MALNLESVTLNPKTSNYPVNRDDSLVIPEKAKRI